MKLLLLLLFAAVAALAQPATTITINQTRANGGVSGDCLRVNANGTVGQTTGCGGGGGAGTVTSVTGTANEINVVNPTTTPVLSLAAAAKTLAGDVVGPLGTNLVSAISGSPLGTTVPISAPLSSQLSNVNTTILANNTRTTGAVLRTLDLDAINTGATLSEFNVISAGNIQSSGTGGTANTFLSSAFFSGGTLTNYAGYRATNPLGTVHPTNAYGLIIEDITAGGTLNRAIKTGAGTVQLGAAVILDTLAGGGTQCVTVDNTGTLGASGATCGAGNGSVQGTIQSPGTSIAITHASTSILSFACFTSGGVWIEPDTVTQTSATVLTLTFLSDQSGGTCNVFTQGTTGASGVSSVSGTAPIVSSGGTTPAISINNFGGDGGAGGTKGAVPAPAAGDAAAGKFLKADGTWAVIAGGTTSFTQIFITNHGNHAASAAISSEFFSSCDATGGNVVLTLPAVPTDGELHNIKRKDASGNLCILDGNGKSIDGGGSVPLTSQYMGISVYYDGTQWWVI